MYAVSVVANVAATTAVTQRPDARDVAWPKPATTITAAVSVVVGVKQPTGLGDVVSVDIDRDSPY